MTDLNTAELRALLAKDDRLLAPEWMAVPRAALVALLDRLDELKAMLQDCDNQLIESDAENAQLEAIEKAAKEYIAADDSTDGVRGVQRLRAADTALRAALDARGTK